MRLQTMVSFCASFLAACTAQQQFPPPPPPAQLSNNPGTRALQIRQYCEADATSKCARSTIYCEAYRREYVPSCMVAEGVSPEYVFVLTR